MYKGFSKYIIILFLISCKPDKNAYQTKVFSNYLKEIGKVIPQTKHLYIVAPKLSCHGCVYQLTTYVENNINILNKKNISIITSKTNLFSNKIASGVDYYLDTKENIDYIDMDLYNITLIETDNQRIEKITQLEAEDGINFVSYLKKYNHEQTP